MSPPELQVRPATAADLPAIQEISALGGQRGDDSGVAESYLRFLLATATVLVAEHGSGGEVAAWGAVVGPPSPAPLAPEVYAFWTRTPERVGLVVRDGDRVVAAGNWAARWSCASRARIQPWQACWTAASGLT